MGIITSKRAPGNRWTSTAVYVLLNNGHRAGSIQEKAEAQTKGIHYDYDFLE